MKVQVINKSKHPLPQYATEQSAGMDLRANLNEPIVLKPLQRCLVPTGLFMALPKGFEAQVRPRSGLAIKKGIGVLNSPGTRSSCRILSDSRTRSGTHRPFPARADIPSLRRAQLRS